MGQTQEGRAAAIPPADFGLQDLQEEVFHLALWASLGLAACLLVLLIRRGPVIMSTPADIDFGPLALLALPALVAASRWTAARISVTYGSLTLLLGLGAILTAAIRAEGDAYLAFWFALLIILASSILGNRANAISCLLVWAVTVWLASENTISENAAWSTVLFTALVAAVSRLSSQPAATALAWSWHHFLRAQAQAQQLQAQQGDLVRAMEMLRQTNERLEQANQDLERAREAAEEARRLKAQFAANVSHELRSPLGHIVGFAEMMVTKQRVYGTPLPAPYQDDLEAIHRSARHLARLIDDVLDLSQIEAGRMALVKERVPTADIVEDAVSVVKSALAAKGLELVVDVPQGLPALSVDRVRIRQVLINLLNNAARFTDHGSVAIGARAKGDSVSLTVSDTGIGIAQGDLPKVFEEFRQLDGSPARRYDGSGLGLAICKRFVEIHGGSIAVSSELGVGSTFTVDLPTRPAQNPSTHGPDYAQPQLPEVVPSTPERTMLLLSDDPLATRLFERHIEGFQVQAVAEAKTRSRVDVVVLAGPQMMTNRQCLEAAQAQAPNAFMVVCSTTPPTPERWRASDFVATVAKPATVEVIGNALRAAVQKPRSVLIVDDDPDTTHLLERMVRASLGRCTVYSANSGQEALALLQRRKPDVVLLDLVMPGIDGRAVLAQMREDDRLRTVPVIAVSGQDQGEDALGAETVLVTRRGGIPTGRLLRCVNAMLDALTA